MKPEFSNKVLIIGYGSVSQCTLPLLLDKLDVPLENITLIDFEDKSKSLRKYTNQGLTFVREKITPENLSQVLSRHMDNDGLIIDLSWNIDAIDIITWCHEHNVLYVNTSVEVWDPTEDFLNRSLLEKSLYLRQMKLLELSRDWKDAPTAVVDHGANPGLITHFVKQGLLDIAERTCADKKVSPEEAEEIRQLAEKRDFAHLAHKLGVKVIHCSERDTQVANRAKEVDEFVGTWSIEGLREEGTAPVEIAWGTHENKMPPMAQVPDFGPQNVIFMPQMGMNTWVRSWIPDQEIVGMVIRHGESYGLSKLLTVWDQEKAVFRPTIHYAYMPCHDTLSSLFELRGRNYELQPKLRIMTNEIVSGEDILGALLMGHSYNSWWTGSALSIDDTRSLAPGQNATTLQVAAGVVAAVLWMLENPKEGIRTPEDLPHDFVLNIALPYLGNFISTPSDWTPLKNRKVFFKENPAVEHDPDPWQFENFQFIG
ncbi:saccharopine dehydrogenase C-terminal domain-containing protein [Methanolobus sp. WCC1]|uniref:Homospermidine synthase n=1 Tax=Methanolobus tindarius DSM 2278 TaxID=1090322 RepID=W9E0D8_METTI|nr:saccharopine dehydrogenase C-terminal domain-containing protein [Methanolobus tindarius]ETA69422.1 homospermidine synthase [Methanolobus tindarius DSM 2278]